MPQPYFSGADLSRSASHRVPDIDLLARPDYSLTTAAFGLDIVSGVGSGPVVHWPTLDVIFAVVYRKDVVVVLA